MFRIVSLAIVLTLIIVLGLTFFKVVAPFLLPLFVAGMTVILAQPLFHYFVERTNGRVRLAAGLTTTAVVALILLPLTIGVALASMQMYAFAIDVSSAEQWRAVFGTGEESAAGEESVTGEEKAADGQNQPTQAAVRIADWINESFRHFPDGSRVDALKLETAVRERIRTYLIGLGNRSLGLVTGVVTSVAFSLLGAVVALFIYTVALYYFFADGNRLVTATEQLLPLHAKYQRHMLDQFATVVRSVVSATFFAALAQAFAVTVALWFFGFGHLVTLFMLCLLSAMIPVAGTWLVWGPCAVILATRGDWVSASLLTVYGAGFVGVLDNFIRAYILNVDIKLHPLLALISVLGGLQVMGLWGVFIGPIVASCLHALIRIFNLELAELSRSRIAQEALARAGVTPEDDLDDLREAERLSSVLSPEEASEIDDARSAADRRPVTTAPPDVPATTVPPPPASSGSSPGRKHVSRRERKKQKR